MTKILIAILSATLVVCAHAKPTRGYIKKDGTYVAPHQKTAPNRSKADNYSSKPNVNPYNGKKGTVDPYKPAAPKK